MLGMPLSRARAQALAPQGGPGETQPAQELPDEVVFDFENQTPTGEKPIGALGRLELSRGDFTATLRRPGSVFDLVSNRPPGHSYFKDASWGEVSLSTFFDQYSPTPLLIDFSGPASSASITAGDYSEDVDTLRLEAFSGPGATGQLLAVDEKSLQPNGDGWTFNSEKLTVAAPGIRSLRLICGSPAYLHSMFYDNLTVHPGRTAGSS